jgi:hypothetical protein
MQVRIPLFRSPLALAKWLAHLPFTSEAAGSSLSENFLNATRTQSSCEKSKKSQRSAESRGFSPGAPVSSHRESWQGGLGEDTNHKGGLISIGTQVLFQTPVTSTNVNVTNSLNLNLNLNLIKRRETGFYIAFTL